MRENLATLVEDFRRYGREIAVVRYQGNRRRVSTYGDIAHAAGLSSPRLVGWIMRTDSSDLPWHRVITASGRPAEHLRTRQLELLRAEGVLAVDGRIPLAQLRHDF